MTCCRADFYFLSPRTSTSVLRRHPMVWRKKIAAADKEEERKDTPLGLVQITDNLFYATGKSGVFVTRHGFRVAFVGGVWDAQKYAESAAEPL